MSAGYYDENFIRSFEGLREGDNITDETKAKWKEQIETERVKAYHSYDMVKEHREAQENAVNQSLEIDVYQEDLKEEAVPMAVAAASPREMKRCRRA